MWGDESVTYQLAHRDLTQIWRTAQHVDLVHAFYYTIMHEIYGLVGGGLLTLRLPSVLAMSAAAAGVGLLGLRLTGPRAGLLAGLVFPLVPQIQRYTQEGRSYAMVCALVTWATYVLVDASYATHGGGGRPTAPPCCLPACSMSSLSSPWPHTASRCSSPVFHGQY
jgi:mannosyltransferase